MQYRRASPPSRARVCVSPGRGHARRLQRQSAFSTPAQNAPGDGSSAPPPPLLHFPRVPQRPPQQPAAAPRDATSLASCGAQSRALLTLPPPALTGAAAAGRAPATAPLNQGL
eukprot:362203-Chlamydomonas_euryale.AAC.15